MPSPDPPSPARPPEPSWDGVAGKLLKEKFLLTALELYLELEERGRDLPVLKEYFSNPVHFEARTATEPHPQAGPGMFRTSSQTTLDSLDWGRLSEDGERVGDERVAVLEFELRKAKETIQGLRATLTQATELRPPTATTTTTTNPATTTTTTTTTTPPSSGAAGQGGVGWGERSATAPPPPHERRTLNFLINEYLASASYKLTAITFADENDDQDFEHWDDVGLNTSRPPSLVQLLRDSGGGGSGDDNNHHHRRKTTTTAATQTQEEVVVVTEVEELREVVMRQERELEKLHHRLTSPIAPPSPGPAPDRTQGEGRPATTLSPGGSTIRVDTGRESPEGTSDSEGGATGGSGATGASGFVMIPSPTSPEEDLEECPAPPDSIEELLAGANEPLEISPPQDSISDQITEILESGAAEDVPRDVSEAAGEAVEEVVSPDDPCPASAPEVEGPAGAGQHLEFLVTEAKRLLSGSSGRRAPPGLEDRVLHAGLICAAGRSGARVAEALAGWGGADLAGVVAKTLPRIAPNVILAKREEVVPLVVAGAGQQTSAQQREVLLGLLFSLMKRPDEEQRAALLGGLGALARVIGPPRLEAELLPRVWDDLAHRRPERRLLVAGAVAALAPHTPASLRNSLLLSMVLQLLAGGPGGERDPQVREAALTSLALLATFMDDTDKLPQLTDVLTQTLASPSPAPHQPTATHPSPGLELLAKALLCWGLEAGRLAAVVDPLLDLLAGQVAVAGQGGAVVASTVRLFTGAVVPVLLASLVTSVPGATSQDGPPDTPAPALPPPPPCPALEGLQEVLGEGWGGAEAGLALLHTHLAREWLPPWPALDYLVGRVLPGLLGALAGLQAWPGPALDAFLDLFSQLPQCLGPALTASTLAPLFLARLDGADPEAVRRCATGLTGPVAVVYAVSLLGQGGADTAGLEGFLSRQISILGLCGAPLTAPLLTVASLMAAPRQAEAVLAALWASVVHRAPAVRCAAAGLWGAAVTGAEEGALGPRVVPALVTLAADPEPRVKAATLTPLAAALAAANTPEVVDKVWLQLETLADDPSLVEQLDYHLALAHTTTQLAHTGHPRLIHHFLLPRMCRLAVDGAVGARLGAALLEAYSALTCCSLPDHVIVHFVIPPLQQLQKTLGPTSFDHMETITDLLREYTLRAQSSASIDRATRPTDSSRKM